MCVCELKSDRRRIIANCKSKHPFTALHPGVPSTEYVTVSILRKQLAAGKRKQGKHLQNKTILCPNEPFSAGDIMTCRSNKSTDVFDATIVTAAFHSRLHG